MIFMHIIDNSSSSSSDFPPFHARSSQQPLRLLIVQCCRNKLQGSLDAGRPSIRKNPLTGGISQYSALRVNAPLDVTLKNTQTKIKKKRGKGKEFKEEKKGFKKASSYLGRGDFPAAAGAVLMIHDFIWRAPRGGLREPLPRDSRPQSPWWPAS